MTVTIDDLNHKWAASPAVDFFRPHPNPDNVFFPGLGWSGNWQIGYLQDRLLCDVSVVLKLATCNFFHFVGVKHEGRPVHSVTGLSNVTRNRYDGYEDLKIFGSSLAAFLQLWSKPEPIEQRVAHERRNTHANYRGRLVSQGRSEDLYYPRRHYYVNGFDYKALPWSEIRPHAYVTQLGSEYLIRSLLPWGEPWHHYDRVFLDEFSDFFPRDPGGFGLTREDGYTVNHCRYQDAGMVIQTSCIGSMDDPSYILRTVARLRYRFTNEATSRLSAEDGHIPHARHVYDAVHDFFVDVEFSPRADTPTLGPNYLSASVLSHNWTTTYKLLDYTASHVIPTDYPWKSYTGDDTAFAYEVSVPHIVRQPGAGIGMSTDFRDLLTRDNVKYGNVRDLLSYFSSEVSEVHGNMLPSAALSSNDCLTQFTGSMNLFESIPQLKDAFSGLQNVAELFDGIKSVSRGDPSGAQKVIDALAGGWLFYTYGAKPNYSDAIEAQRVGEDIYNRLGEIGDQMPGHLYGKFYYEPPWKLRGVPGKLSVTTRSKMVLNRSQAVILAWALALDEVGLLPSLTRGYDLIQFSFIFDWLTNLGDRLTDVDRMSLRFAVDISYYVHSFLYKYEIYPDFLARYTCYSSDFCLTKFERYVSRFNPVLRESKYDFHPPRGLRGHLLTSGSLLWAMK